MPFLSAMLYGENMKRIWVIGVGLVLIFSVTGIVYFRGSNIKVINPTRGDITEAVYGLGKVKSNDRFEVISALISTVTGRYVNEGDTVEKGAALIELDHHAKFRAPFRGTVTYVKHFVGETAVPSVTILRLENLEKKYIELSLEQQAILRVKPKQTAKISFESLRGKVLNGGVTSVFPRDDEFIARVFVDGLDPSILPGMSADVTIEVGRIKDAVLIPIKSITNGFVSLRRNNKWEKVKLELGHIDGLNAEVKNGVLSTSDEIRINKEN